MKSNFYRSKLLYLLAFLLSSSWVAFGQNQTITGKVIDEKGEALIGVNIIVKETNKGTTTNVDGKYTLSVPGSSSKIIYTFVSYESKEVSVSLKNGEDIFRLAKVFMKILEDNNIEYNIKTKGKKSI